MPVFRLRNELLYADLAFRAADDDLHGQENGLSVGAAADFQAAGISVNRTDGRFAFGKRFLVEIIFQDVYQGLDILLELRFQFRILQDGGVSRSEG